MQINNHKIHLKMEKPIIRIFLSLLFILFSCSDEFLEKEPYGTIPESSLANREYIESLLIGTYSSLHGMGWTSAWAGSPTNWLYGDVYADDAHTGSEVSDQPDMTEIERYDLYTSNPHYGTKWNAIYEAISRSNSVIRNASIALSNNSISENEAVQFIAEARFLRGFNHLEAIKLWDFVPYVDENNSDGLVPNKPAAIIESNAGDLPWGELGGDGYIPWEEVERDFQYARKHLPVDPRNDQDGRVTKYIAMSMLAKVKLFKGEFQAALQLLDSVIQSNHYALDPDYYHNFTVDGDNNIESILAIQASVNDGAFGMNGIVSDFLNFPYGWNSGAELPGRCCGFYQPSQNLVNVFKTENGLPYLQYFGLDFNAENDDVINDEGIESGDPFVPDTRPLDPRLDWTIGRRGIPYLDWGMHPGKDWIRDQGFGGPYSPKKRSYYKSEQGQYFEANAWWPGLLANNFTLIRFADVLLMAAECEVETGSLNRARDLVNKVRARAARPETWVQKEDGSGPAATYEISEYPVGGSLDPFQSQDGAREAIRFERRLELAMEGHRFWDLKRWGVAKHVLNDYAKKEGELRYQLKGIQFKDKNIRHPIPTHAIDLSQNTLKQNPGY